jgi:iron complex outermembrane receptor protein
MDNYSLRDFVPSMMSMEPAVMNPTRLTNSARAELSLTVNEDLVTRLGIDASENTHENRMTMKQYSMPYQSLPLVEDGYFKQMGMFAETDWQLAPQWFWFNGIRNDQWQADDERNMLMLSMMNMVMNPTANDHREQSLTSGFSRVEYREDGVQAYAGIGHSERFPDYWELIGKARSSETSMSSFYTAPEKTTQLDVGLITSGDKYRLSMSAYYGKINDYILLQVVNPMLPEQLRNIDASIWGAEVGGEWKATDKLALRLSMAASRGSNDTDRTTLPQIAPYEVRFSGDYTLDAWTLGGMYRLVAAQERVVPGQGTIVSLDTTPTAGFGVLSLNAERKWDQWRLNVGIDNALDRQYQEFLSRSSSVVPGYSVVGRVPEPGRSIWAGVNYSF